MILALPAWFCLLVVIYRHWVDQKCSPGIRKDGPVEGLFSQAGIVKNKLLQLVRFFNGRMPLKRMLFSSVWAYYLLLSPAIQRDGPIGANKRILGEYHG
jgi:hypothetical protein